MVAIVTCMVALLTTQGGNAQSTCAEHLARLMRANAAQLDTVSGYGMILTVVTRSRDGSDDTSIVRVDHKGSYRRVESRGALTVETPSDIVAVFDDQRMVLIRDGGQHDRAADNVAMLFGAIDSHANVACTQSTNGSIVFTISLPTARKSPYRSMHITYDADGVLRGTIAYYRDVRQAQSVSVVRYQIVPFASDLRPTSSAASLVLANNNTLRAEYRDYQLFDARARPHAKRP